MIKNSVNDFRIPGQAILPSLEFSLSGMVSQGSVKHLLAQAHSQNESL